MNFTSQSSLLTWSLMKWCRISICFVLECWTWWFVRLMELVLSHSRGTLLTFNPKSSSYCLIHKIWAQQLPVTMYSASVVESATQACFLLCQKIRMKPSRWQVPLVLFLSSLHLQNPNQSIQLNVQENERDIITQQWMCLLDNSKFFWQL